MTPDPTRPVPRGVDVTVPSVARMYDYYLGGKDHYAVDRAAAEEIIAAVPETPVLARANRAFLGRAVRFLAAECGVRQFLDLGTGLPTADNVHQVAQRVDPACQVVYVDNDPIVLAHARALLADNEATMVICADLRDPAAVLKHPDMCRLIDVDEPTAVLFVAVLHFVKDADDPAGLVATYREAVTSGSYVAITHVTWGERRAEVATAAPLSRGDGPYQRWDWQAIAARDADGEITWARRRDVDGTIMAGVGR